MTLYNIKEIMVKIRFFSGNLKVQLRNQKERKKHVNDDIYILLVINIYFFKIKK